MIGNSYTFIEPPCKCYCFCCPCFSCQGCLCFGKRTLTSKRFLINSSATELSTNSSRGQSNFINKQTQVQAGYVDDVEQIPVCCCVEFWCCGSCFQDLSIHGIKTKMSFPCFNCFLCQRYPVENGNRHIGTVWVRYKALCCCPMLSIQNQGGEERFTIQRPCTICMNLNWLCTCCFDKVFQVKDKSKNTVGEIIHKACRICQYQIQANLPNCNETEKLLILNAVDLTWF